MLEAVTQPFLNEFPSLGTGIVSEPYVLCSFTQIVGSTLLDDFRKLRIGFVEAGNPGEPEAVVL